MAKLHLENLHPNLYKAILGHAITHYTVGGLILYSSIKLEPRRPVFAYLFIIAFFLIGTTLLYGLKAPHYRVVRFGLIGGLFVIGFLALVFTLTVGLTLNEEQTIRLAWLAPPWGIWAYLHQLCLQEPPLNPESEIKETEKE